MTMKKKMLSLACFLLVSLTAAQTPPPAPILDTSGQELVTGVQYRIRSSTWGAGEGDINVDPLQLNSSCPLDLILGWRIFAGPGLPVTFHLPDVSEAGHPVRTSTEISIQFPTLSTDTACNDGGFWAVRFDSFLRGFGVTTGGSVGAGDSLFTIESAGGSLVHRLAYCPRISTTRVCGPLTISFHGRLSVALPEAHGVLSAVFERVDEDDDKGMIKMSTEKLK
ncbi:Kunitz trypsin inhibitor [Striga asiatica]|uniref:Kunitz trypsin inhibitor n=1 Tax=Striga asiatica TaxID=4170 RepID=A0A5A7PXU3_STRAF|nr:Kunitz trypsin inhibitor [Striga asiatica]